MSHLVGRILLCMFMFPLAAVVYCSTFLRLDGTYSYSGDQIFPICGLVSWLFVIAYWTLLWRKSVRWTAARIFFPFLTAMGGLLIGGIGFVTLFTSGDLGAHEILLGILVPTLWLIGTVFFWRETADERASRLTQSGRDAISCPVCGYNLTGLSESRCPECGSKFTLDELIAAQPERAAGEIE